MREDPGQVNDVHRDFPALVRALDERLDTWRAAHGQRLAL